MRVDDHHGDGSGTERFGGSAELPAFADFELPRPDSVPCAAAAAAAADKRHADAEAPGRADGLSHGDAVSSSANRYTGRRLER